jgi:hypothetical protein
MCSAELSFKMFMTSQQTSVSNLLLLWLMPFLLLLLLLLLLPVMLSCRWHFWSILCTGGLHAPHHIRPGELLSIMCVCLNQEHRHFAQGVLAALLAAPAAAAEQCKAASRLKVASASFVQAVLQVFQAISVAHLPTKSPACLPCKREICGTTASLR